VKQLYSQIADSLGYTRKDVNSNIWTWVNKSSDEVEKKGYIIQLKSAAEGSEVAPQGTEVTSKQSKTKMATKKDIIYALTNRAMPDWVKFGISSGGEEGLRKRMKALYNTSVPLRFEVVYAARVKNISAREIEKAIAVLLEEERENPKREFYKTSQGKAKTILTTLVKLANGGEELSLDEIKNISNKGVPKNELEELQREERDDIKRRLNFTFPELGIKKGSVLVFTQDETKKATVIGPKKVEYEGKSYSLSGLAKLLLKTRYSVNGSLYWTYKGETLDELRRRKEADKLNKLTEE